MDSIGVRVFYEADALSDIYSLNPTPPVCESSNAFSTTTYSTATLHVPAASVDEYTSANVWSKFASIVGDAESGIESVETDACEPVIIICDGSIEVEGIDGTVSIYSTSGALVTTGDVGSAINVPGDGIYIVRVNTGGNTIARKVAVR